MNKWLQRRFALSEEGAKNFVKGVIYSTLNNIALLLPSLFVFIFLYNCLNRWTLGSMDLGVWGYVLIALGFIVVMYMVGILQYKSVFSAVYDESRIRRVGMAEKLRRLPLAFFGEKNLSDLTATMMDDCTDLEHTFSHAVPQLFAALITLVLIGIGMFIYEWRLALALFWVIPIALGIMLIAKKRAEVGNRKSYLNARRVTEVIESGLDNVAEIKAYNCESGYSNILSKVVAHNETNLVKNEMGTSIQLYGAQSFLKLGLPTVVIVGLILLNGGLLSMFDYLVFLVLGTCIYTPITEVLNNLVALYFLDVRIDRMKEMNDMPTQGGKEDFYPENYDITFQHVKFGYEQGKGVLEDVSFVAKQGEVTALVGPSGCGKSTVAKLAVRFWDVDAGQILLGGENINQVDPEALLRYFAVVFQDVVLFNTSVMDNIRLGRRDASDEEVLRVAHLAQCDEFVEKLPEGYHTIIGENGETLSGGERQRISIARALLKDAPIVVLDEATASLDVENETKVQAGISELVQGKTVLIIAHRMRTIATADKVVVLREGKVVEMGSPAELMTHDGYFSSMTHKQRIEK